MVGHPWNFAQPSFKTKDYEFQSISTKTSILSDAKG